MTTSSTPVNPQQVEALTNDFRIRLYERLNECLSEDDLRTLCFFIGTDYENLPAAGKAGKVRELIAYHERQRSLLKLLDQCRKDRPNVPWDEMLRPTGLVPIAGGVSQSAPTPTPEILVPNLQPQQPRKIPAEKPGEADLQPPQQPNGGPTVKPGEADHKPPIAGIGTREADSPPEFKPVVPESPPVYPEPVRTRRWVFWVVFGAVIAEAAVWAWYFWLDRWVKVPPWALITFCLLVPALVYLVYRAIADN